MASVHQFKVKDGKGNEVDMADYKGKVLLIVNTATGCGFSGQLESMEKLYEDFKPKGLEVLAFPSNDFDQEAKDGENLHQFCEVRYGAKYKIFDKVHVKGSNAIDLFKFLSDKKQNGKVGVSPKWNFQKYLVDKDGQVVDYYLTITDPNGSKVRKAIEKLL